MMYVYIAPARSDDLPSIRCRYDPFFYSMNKCTLF